MVNNMYLAKETATSAFLDDTIPNKIRQLMTQL